MLVPRREARILEARGERFRFYWDGEVLHIEQRHGTTTDDAIATFFDGGPSQWDTEHRRYETLSETHGIYWARHAHDGSVIIISCWKRENI